MKYTLIATTYIWLCFSIRSILSSQFQSETSNPKDFSIFPDVLLSNDINSDSMVQNDTKHLTKDGSINLDGSPLDSLNVNPFDVNPFDVNSVDVNSVDVVVPDFDKSAEKDDEVHVDSPNGSIRNGILLIPGIAGDNKIVNWYINSVHIWTFYT